MIPDNKTPPPAPQGAERLVKEFAQAIAELTAASGRSGSDTYLQPFRDRARSAKAALLAEFSRLAKPQAQAPEAQAAYDREIAKTPELPEIALRQFAGLLAAERLTGGPLTWPTLKPAITFAVVEIDRLRAALPPAPSPQGTRDCIHGVGLCTGSCSRSAPTPSETLTAPAPKGTEPPARPVNSVDLDNVDTRMKVDGTEAEINAWLRLKAILKPAQPAAKPSNSHPLTPKGGEA